MKKFFGVLLIIIGGLWALFMLITAISSIGEGGIGVVLFFLALGVLLMWLGIRMVKGKKKAKKQVKKAKKKTKKEKREKDEA